MFLIVRHDNEERSVLKLCGEISHKTIPLIEGEIGRLLQEGIHQIELDCSGTDLRTGVGVEGLLNSAIRAGVLETKTDQHGRPDRKLSIIGVR